MTTLTLKTFFEESHFLIYLLFRETETERLRDLPWYTQGISFKEAQLDGTHRSHLSSTG